MKIFEGIFTYFKNNKLIFITVITIFILGIIFGCYSLISLTEEELSEINNYTNKFFSASAINTSDKKAVFLEDFIYNLKLLTIVWISGFFVFLIPVSLFQIFFKGFRTGFSIAYFAGIYKFKGITYSFFNYFFGNLILLPLLIFFTVYCIKNSVKNSNHFLIKKNIFNSFIVYLSCIVSSLLISFLDGYFITYMLKTAATINF